MTFREPEWTEEQQNLMLALGLYRQQQCPGCGGYLPDTTAPEAEGAYKAEPPVRCQACTTRYEASSAHIKAPHAPHPEALLWPVIRR